MRKQVIEHAAHEVATQIRTVEDCIEDALVEIADLQFKMLRARAAAGIATRRAMPRSSSLPPPSRHWSRRGAAWPIAMANWSTPSSSSPVSARSASAKAANVRPRSPKPTCALSPDRLIGRIAMRSPAK